MKNLFRLCLPVIISILFLSSLTTAQTSVFTYQGKLTDMSAAANGQYDFTFRLFDTVSGGTQIGSDTFLDNVAVAGGIFTVNLDFGAAAFAGGATRFLEISVRSGAGTGAFTTLAPRQEITSAPFSIQTLKATSADALSNSCVLCVTDAHIQSIDGSKITGTVASAVTANNVSGIVPVTNGGTGSSTQNFVDLSTNQSNIGGNKSFTGAVSVSGAGGIFNGNGSGLTNLNGANITNGSVTSVQLSSDALPNNNSLKLLGSLRWDLLKGQKDFAVGTSPMGIAFDGTNMWISNSNSVTKLRASDGANLGSFPTGSGSRGIAFDGANIWVANFSSNTITKLRASDGANLGSIDGILGPAAIAFDGTYVWIVSQTSNNVVKIRASDNAAFGTFSVVNIPGSIVFDGANIFVAGLSAGITKLRASDGANITTFNDGFSSHTGLAFDGANIWIGNGGNSVTKLRASDGANLGNFTVGINANSIAFDGSNVWITIFNGASVTKLRASDGTLLGTFPVGAFPRGLAFDGVNMWVANSVDSSVTKLPPAFP